MWQPWELIPGVPRVVLCPCLHTKSPLKPKPSSLCCALVPCPCGAWDRDAISHGTGGWWLWAALLSWAVIKCALGGPNHLVWLNHLNSQNRSGSRIALLLLHIVEPRFLPAYPWLCSREECGKTVLINLQLSLH